MPNIEKRILVWIEEHLALVAMLAFAVAGIVVRLPLMGFVSGDSKFFLLPWYEEIRKQGLVHQVGNYNLVYQLLIYGMTKLPLEPLYAYKILSIGFDYLLALASAGVAWRVSRTDRLWKSIFTFGAVVLSPVVFLNSAAWAQCDAIYVFFAVAALTALLRERYRVAMIFVGLSFSFKLQAAFLLPLLLFVYFRKRKFSILEFLWIPLVMCLTGLPAAFFGRSPLEIFEIYNGQTQEYPYLSMNYPSVWVLVASGMDSQHYEWLSTPAIVFTVCVLAVLMLSWMRAGAEPREQKLVYMAFLLVYSCVLCLPGMHERYGYLYEILAVVIACLCPATIPLCVGLIGVSVCTYGEYLFKIEILGTVWLAIIHLAIYIGYTVLLNRQISDKADG